MPLMIPSPPRSPVLPQVVLLKLSEPDVVHRQRRRAHSETSRSASLPRQSRPKLAFRPFSLTSSMERNLQHLHRIGKELEEVNKDLSVVIDKQRHFSFENASQESNSFDSNENSSVSLEENNSSTNTPEFSRDFFYSAVQNFEMAGLAFEEFVLIMSDIKLSYQIEEKELVSRASCLTRESEKFKKMTSDALAKLKTVSTPVH